MSKTEKKKTAEGKNKKVESAENKPRAIASGINVWCRHDDLCDITTLVPNDKNPNKHPDKQIALLAKIIRHQGWRQPITVSKRSGFIVKGHGRFQAAKVLNVELVPVEYQDYETEAAEMADLIGTLICEKIQRKEKTKFGIELACPVCGEMFYQHPSDTKLWCSKKCSDIGRQKNSRFNKSCMMCGKEFVAINKQHSNNSNNYCSLKCRNLAYKLLVGEKNHNWKGGKRSIRAREQGRIEYSDWRRSVYDRDNYICQRCGERGGKLEAHHIKPFATHYELRFDVNNGMTLCKSCHKKEHAGNFREDLKI